MKQTKWHIFAWPAILVVIAAVYFGAINPDKLGFYHDDGLYVVTAKALATDQGYRILSLPDRPLQTKYPPLFAFALSLIWRAAPEFPANRSLLASLSALSMLVFLSLSVAYLLKEGYATRIEALLVLLFAAFNWRTVVLATSTLSEALYAALAILALWLAAPIHNRFLSMKRVGLGVVMALAGLTRLPGLSLPAALFFHAFMRRRVRLFLVPILMGFAAVAGWFWWCGMHHSAAIPPYGHYYTNYFQDWRDMIAGEHTMNDGSVTGAFASMAGNNTFALMANIPVVCLGVGMDWHKGLNGIQLFLAILLGLSLLILLFAGFWRTRRPGFGMLHSYVLVYLALHVAWPYSLFDRFLIPLLPFILFFIVSEAKHLVIHARTGFGAHGSLRHAALVIFLCLALPAMLGIAAYSSTYGFYYSLLETKISYAAIARQDGEIIEWLKSHSDSGDVLSCYRDPVYYLHTDRPAIRLPVPHASESVRAEDERLLRFFDQNKVKLLVRTDNDFSLESQPAACRLRFKEWIERYPVEFVPVYFTSDCQGMIYRTNINSRTDGR